MGAGPGRRSLSDPRELYRMNGALENVYPAGEGRRHPHSHMLLLSGRENEVASETEGPVLRGKLQMPAFGNKAHRRQAKGVQN